MLRDDTESDRPTPVLADLPQLVEQTRLAGVPVTLCCADGWLATVPDGIGRHAYRIVQEALTNAGRHAPGAAVRVRLDRADDAGLVVEVSDGGAPGGPQQAGPGAGSGLIGLGERVQLLGGRLEHGPLPAGGFRLRAWLPWPP
jgi:signal transduction histidine kinase